MAELISLSVYKIEPKLGSTPVITEVAQKPFDPKNLEQIDDIPAAQRIATALPRIYGKVVANEGGLLKEYLVAETAAQIVTKANAALS